MRNSDTASRPRGGKRERLGALVGSPPVVSALRLLFRQPGIVCVTHHRIADRVLHDPDVISASPHQLGEQAEWVGKTFRTVSGDEVEQFVGGRLDLRDPAVAFTFDDAYSDNFEAGRMLKERYGIRATFFVPTAFIESGVIPPWDRLGYAAQHAPAGVLRVPAIGQHGPWAVPLADYGQAISTLMAAYSALPAECHEPFVAACEKAAGRRAADERESSPFMTWAQIRALRDMGHSIGAHTHTHPVLAALSPSAQATEIATSKRILEEQLGEPVTLFAYPYGKPQRSFTETTKRLVGECGFRAAFSFYGGWNRPGRTDAYDVRRIKVDPTTTLPMFKARVTSRGTIPL